MRILKQHNMKFASVCSGIEAASAAWNPLGWQAAWFSEIEKFPCAVLAHHHPEVPNLGDLLAITEDQIHALGPVDVLVGGTPCQSFSVAGLRGGLDDARGNLALRFVQLAGIMRPRWVVWENVPGVLSSGGGRDFGSIVGALAKLGYGWSYRILDAQYFGVAQRRRRVFLVGHLGDWRRAAAVFLERACLCGNPAPSRTTRKESTCGTLLGTQGGSDVRHAEASQLVAHSLTSRHDSSEDGCGRGTPLVPVASPLTAGGNPNSNSPGRRREDDTNLVAIAFDAAQITSKANRSRVSPELPVSTLSSEIRMHAAYGMQVRRLTPRECERLQGFSDDYTLIPFRGKPAADGPRYKALGNSMAVPCMRWIGERIQEVGAS